MKFFTLFACLTFSVFFSYSQKKGYKDITIGENIYTLSDSHQYNILKSNTSSNSFYITGDTLMFCGSDIDHFQITTDNQSIITEICLYTKKVNFSDYDMFAHYMLGKLLTIKNNLGSPSMTNIGKGEMKLITMWVFNDTKTYLTFRYDDVGTMAKSFASSYLVIWQKGKTESDKMW